MIHCVCVPSHMCMREHNSKETHALDIVWSSIPFPIDHSIYDSSLSQTGIHKSSLMSKTDSKTDGGSVHILPHWSQIGDG